MSDWNVLVPNRFGGLDVCDLFDLANRVSEADDDADADEILTDTSFDTTMGFGSKAKEVEALIARVRRLNETGNVTEYWNPPE
jgi:hypothetical protein